MRDTRRLFIWLQLPFKSEWGPTVQFSFVFFSHFFRKKDKINLNCEYKFFFNLLIPFSNLQKKFQMAYNLRARNALDDLLPKSGPLLSATSSKKKMNQTVRQVNMKTQVIVHQEVT